MKLYTAHFPEKTFADLLTEVQHLDFSLFVSTIPQSQDQLSSVNIIALAEPNEYFGWNKWVIENKNLFNVIFTFEDNILNNCENARFLTLAHTWLQPDQYNKERQRRFELAHLCGALKKAPGHLLRHELMDRQNEIKIPTRFYPTIGDRYNIEDARVGRETVYADSQFNVAIENVSRRGWFTEKLIDCFLFKTLPVYWGCSNIGDFFNTDGIIKFDNVDDLIYISNNHLSEELYNSKKDVLEENHKLALEWINYEKALTNQMIEIFKFNKLV
jgi:hypothetical protein